MLVVGAVAHELVHSVQGVVLGNGWHWPVFFPVTMWVCPFGPQGWPALACTEVGDGFAEHWWSGEGIAYATQAVVVLGSFLVIRRQRIEAAPARGPARHMPIRFDMVPAHRFTLMAWMFLEDAANLAKQPPNAYPKLLLHLERYLGCCAIMLRAACEAHWGRGRFDKAPDQGAMAFISAARHVTAHGNASPVQSEPKSAEFRWDAGMNAGHAIVEVTTGLDMQGAGQGLKSQQERDAATRFLARHDGDLYRALHHAVDLVAGWVGQVVDDDFRALLNVQVGRMRLRAALSSPEAFRKIVEAFTKGQGAELGDQSVLELLGPETAPQM